MFIRATPPSLLSRFLCDGASPTSCYPSSGDGKRVGAEARAGGCDDGNLRDEDGCDATCSVEPGWFCGGEPSDCTETCGNGVLDGDEECDDQNPETDDGCVACAIADGWTCDEEPSTCTDVDECATAEHDCDVNADCMNFDGGFSCTCKRGYVGNGVECERPSCHGMTGDECRGEDCCTSLPVPAGTFLRGRGSETCPTCASGCPSGVSCASDEVPEHMATLESFELDRYEVTVGRFRRFLADYDGTPPAAGSGAHPSGPEARAKPESRAASTPGSSR